jgi:hypothetical protein
MEFNRNQQIALLNALYGVTLASMGNRNDKAKQAVLNPDLKIFFDDVLNLKQSLQDVAKGKNIELYPIGLGLRNFVRAFGNNPPLNPKVAELIKAFGLYFRAGSTGAWKKIEFASASPVFPDWVRTAFTKRVGDQSQVVQALKQIVRTLTGKDDIAFPDLDSAAKAKTKQPNLYKEYLKLRRQFNEIWKSELSNFVRSSGQPMVDMEDLEKHFKSIGMDDSLPTGFTGKIDANGVWYDKNGRKLNGVPSATIFPQVRMNPKADPDPSEWVFVGIKADGSVGNYYYPIEEIRKRKSEKFGKVADLSAVIDHVRSRWLTGIKHFSEEHKETVAAVELELLYQFSARIGTLGNSAAGKATFGLGTLLVKNVKLEDRGFEMRYQGKDNVATRHKYSETDAVSKMIVAAVHSLCAGKKPSEPLFTFKQSNGERKMVPPALVNKVFHVLGAPKGVTVHKLRSLKGTQIFNEEVAKLKARNVTFKGPADAMKVLTAIATKVGKELNHVRRGIDGGQKATGQTALTAYIDVQAQVDFFEYFNLPLPAYLSKMAGRHELSTAITAAEGDESTKEETPSEETPKEESPKSEEETTSEEDKPAEKDLDKAEGEQPLDEAPKEKKDKPKSEEDDEDEEGDVPTAEDYGVSTDLLERILTSPDSTMEELFDLPGELL